MRCPDDATFAAFLAGTLGEPEAFEAHVDACAACRETLAALARMAAPSAPAGGPARPRPRGAACGRYLVLDVLGAGGMGVVYAAYDPELDRKVALKLVRPHAARGAADLRARLAREARVLARISHPNVVPVYDVGEEGGDVFVAMEFVAGPTLARWRAQAPRGWREVLEMYLQAARGLAHAHAAGVVHRDFKPSNAIVGPEGRVRVVDFGLALAGEGPASAPEPRASASLTATGALVGTPQYMAPEQWRGGPVDARSDQYSLCASLWEALAGAPYHLPDTTWRDRYVPTNTNPGTWPAAAPRWLRALLLRGLAADPAERFPAVEALIAACERRLRRSRRGALALAAGGAALGVAAWSPWAAAPAPTCEDDPTLLAAVWDPAAAEGLRAAFARSGQPYAETSAASVVAALDDYAGRWREEHRAACEATRVFGHQTEAALAQRTACLEDLRGALRERVALLRRGEADLVEHALAIVHDLPAATRCREPAALAAYAADDAGPERRAARAAVDRAEALLRAGRFAAAEEALAPAATLAERRGWHALAAAALRLRGEARQGRGDAAGAEDAFYLSLWEGEAARDDRLIALAWIRLTSVLADELARPAEARRAVGHARAALARGDDDPRLGAEAQVSAAAAARASGDFAGAQTLLQEAAATLAARAPGDPLRLTALRQLGRSRYDAGDLQGSAAEYRRALAVAERSLGAAHPAVADLANNLGTTLIDLREPDAAEVELQRALEIGLRTYGPDHLTTAATRTNLANLAHFRGDQAEAERRYRAALATYAALPVPHPDAAKVAYNFGMLLINMSRPAEAREQFQFALGRLRATLGEDHPDAGAFLTGVGVSLSEQGRFAEAVAPLEESVRVFERHPRDPRFLASARNELARALWESGGDRVRARALAEQAAAAFRERPEAAGLLREVETWLAAHPAGS